MVRQKHSSKDALTPLQDHTSRYRKPRQQQDPPQIPTLFPAAATPLGMLPQKVTLHCSRGTAVLMLASQTSLQHSRVMETSSQYFSIASSCSGRSCKIKLTTPKGVHGMLTSHTWAAISGSKDPSHHEPLEEWITHWFDWKAASLPSSCAGCHATYVQTHSFQRPAWIWFEVFLVLPNVALPCFSLSLFSHTYRLAAVMYGDGCYFVARLSTPSGSWLRYDGRVIGGRQVAVSITREEGLLTRGSGYTTNLLLHYLGC